MPNILETTFKYGDQVLVTKNNRPGVIVEVPNPGSPNMISDMYWGYYYPSREEMFLCATYELALLSEVKFPVYNLWAWFPDEKHTIVKLDTLAQVIAVVAKLNNTYGYQQVADYEIRSLCATCRGVGILGKFPDMKGCPECKGMRYKVVTTPK